MIPRVSVIVPVLNGAGHIERCLEALRAQSYPADRLELIVADNGSVDETRAHVRDHGVALVVERRMPSPYVARNAGIRRATGDVVAFTDSDCVPAKDWVERGVARLEAGADLVGGEVLFGFASRPSAAEIVDAVKNLDHERSIAERGVAKTGNLFVSRRVFDEIGLFAEDRRSGGDVAFTRRATGAGFSLVYAPDAVVEKPARRAAALARKQYRVGRGECRLWRERGAGSKEIAGRVLRSFGPPPLSYLRAQLARRGPMGWERRVLSVWLSCWAIGVVQGLGRLHGWMAPERRRG